MAVVEYSKKTQGHIKLATNFTVAEFACEDGTDKVLVDLIVPQILQLVRIEHGNRPLIITSAFRTTKHNKAVGGVSNSQHLYGKAADFYISGIAPLTIALYLEWLGAHGIGLYSNFIHVDNRDGKSFWDQRSGVYKSVTTFGAKTTLEKELKQKTGLGDDAIKHLYTYKYPYDLATKIHAALK